MGRLRRGQPRAGVGVPGACSPSARSLGSLECGQEADGDEGRGKGSGARRLSVEGPEAGSASKLFRSSAPEGREKIRELPISLKSQPFRNDAC